MYRAVIALGALILAGLAFANAMVNVVRAEHPELALRIASGDAGALAVKADTLLSSSGTKVSAELLDKLAVQSIKAQPISARAVRLHGFAADRRGDAAGTLRSIQLAERLSRRELMAHLWMIEHAAQKGDTNETLRYYDLAMRTSDPGRRILFPILSGALSDREIRTGLLPYMRADPPWLASFLSYAVLEGRDPVSVANLIAESGGLPAAAKLDAVQRQLVGRMVDADAYDAARNFASRVLRADRRVFTEFGFDRRDTDERFAPLTWVRPSSAGIDTEFYSRNGQWLARLSADTSARGLALQRLIFLPAGTYSIVLPAELKQGAGTLKLAVGCRASGRNVTLLDQELDPAVPRPFTVAVPANCGGQFLSISLLAGDGNGGATFELRSPVIRKL